MKKRMFMLLLTASLFSIKAANAQKPYEMTVEGVKVIVQPGGNDIIEIQTIIKGGVQNYPATKAGVEALAFNSLSECGTLKQDKNTIKNKLDKLSAAVYGFAAKDYAASG
jgi:zinc protease